MKEKILKKTLIILLLVIQILQLGGNILYSNAAIQEGDVINLKGDHECDSVVEYWMEDYQKWSYKIVWYVYYIDKDDGNKYPAFCIEPAKEGVGTGHDSYDTTLRREKDNRIWRVLNKGYMGTSYKEWDIECDDDFYSATKIALHSIVEGIAPKDKYILGNRSVDGNTVEEIQRRGAKVLEVAQTLYQYGLNGTEAYTSAKVSVTKQGENKIETINNISYYVQNYKASWNKTLKSYEVEIENFPSGTKIFNSKNQEQIELSENYFKIAIPINKIKENIKGNIKITNAQIKTNPIYYCQSPIEDAQSYVTYTKGYEKAETSTILEIKANNCNIQIQKVDKETNKPISNVTFEILDEKKNKITEVTTDKNGIAKLNNLYPQTITVKEIKVPEPYILSKEEKQVKLEWQKTSEVIFENERKKGNLKIEKVDAEDNNIKLENVEFKLYDTKGNLIKKLVTNEKGEAYIENLDIGTYILKETKAKEGYYLTNDRNIQIKWNETTIEKIENEKQKGQIEVYKVDKENKKQRLEGVIFEVLDENKKRVETIITNKEGYSKTSKLPIGNYYLKEIKTNNKYILNENLIEVEIKNEQITTLNIENQKKKGQIEIYKVDSENNEIELQNVEFEVLDKELNVVDKLITDEEGYSITKELPIGEYYIKEVKTNENYVLNEEKIKVEVEYGKIQKIKFENEKIKGQIEILKISEDDNLINGNKKGCPIENVEFEIRNKNGQFIEKIITNKKGIAISSKLEKGTYIIKEIKTHKDYEITQEEFEIQIVEHEKIEQITITNKSKDPELPKLPRTGF